MSHSGHSHKMPRNQHFLAMTNASCIKELYPHSLAHSLYKVNSRCYRSIEPYYYGK